VTAVASESWTADGTGFYTRRGRVDRGPIPPPDPVTEVVILENSEDGLPTGALSNANMRTYLDAPTMNVPSEQLSKLSCTNVGGSYGKVITIALPASSSGIVLQPKLSESFDEGYIEFDYRVRSGGGTGKGGKFPGLGGCAGSLGAPPSGGNHNPRGWCGRCMELGDSVGGQVSGQLEWIGYKYWPGGGAAFGIELRTGVGVNPESGTADGDWHHNKTYYRMNHSTVTNMATDPATLVSGTHYSGVGGYFSVELDNPVSPQYEQGDRDDPSSVGPVLRYYEPAKITNHSYARFQGGNDTWGQVQTTDIANYRIVKVVRAP